jgi:hypothetical protein
VASVGGQQHVLVKPSQPGADVAGTHAASTDLDQQFRSEAPLTPGYQYDAECGFWADPTGWDPRDSPLVKFRCLTRPAGMPLRLLLQRTDDQPGTTVRAHPDLACSGVDAEVARHEGLGSTRWHDGDGWIAMRDPAGLAYCITRRDPGTGAALRHQRRAGPGGAIECREPIWRRSWLGMRTGWRVQIGIFCAPCWRH